jgi:ribosome biogenesis GTPase A
MADPAVTEAWTEYYKAKGFIVLQMDSRVRKQTLKVTDAVRMACKDKIERDKRRGIVAVRPIKAMVAGIPNVGKSTFINSYVGKTTAKTGNKPGVTRGNQWIRISKDVNLLDTPGILWPKLGSEEIGLRLALIGSINDNILELREITLKFLDFLVDNYCNILKDRYIIEKLDNREALLEEITLYKKCIKKGGKSPVFPSVSGDFEAAHIFSHEGTAEGTERHFSRKPTLFNL